MPTAGIPSWAARSTNGPIRHAPSRIEYSLWTWRWTYGEGSDTAGAVYRSGVTEPGRQMPRGGLWRPGGRAVSATQPERRPRTHRDDRTDQRQPPAQARLLRRRRLEPGDQVVGVAVHGVADDPLRDQDRDERRQLCALACH